MNSLAADLEEMTDDWVREQRRRWGLLPDEPSCWAAYVEMGDDRSLRDIGRSAGDVIWTCEQYVQMTGCYRRLGLGSWIIESAAGDEDSASTFLRVRVSADVEQW